VCTQCTILSQLRDSATCVCVYVCVCVSHALSSGLSPPHNNISALSPSLNLVPLPLHPASPANTYPDAANLWATPDASAGSSGYKRLKYIPFNPVDKFTMAVVQEPGANGRTVRIMKGAPQVCFLVTVCTHVAASCICGILYWCAGRCVHERQWVCTGQTTSACTLTLMHTADPDSQIKQSKNIPPPPAHAPHNSTTGCAQARTQCQRDS
jgi:hypothetical protein